MAVAIGCALRAAVAYFLKVLIDNSPADIDLRRLRLFHLMVITSGGLGGFAIETMGELQEEDTDPPLSPEEPIPGPPSALTCKPSKKLSPEAAFLFVRDSFFR